LAYDRTYYVTIEPGVVTDAGGAIFVGFPISTPGSSQLGLIDANRREFAGRGGGWCGDFCTVQAAVDFVPKQQHQASCNPG
jgi:hypothetical protein